MTNSTIIFGDSRYVLDTLPDESVALVVTSPPYFVGREYESYLKTEAEYWNLMSDVFSKMGRIVEPFGKVAINFGDRYANSALLGKPCEVLYAHEFDTIMQDAGFLLWARIIWDKVGVYIQGANHLASPRNKTGQMRIAPNWEYIFIWRKDSTGTPPDKQTDMTQEERVKWTDGIWQFSSVAKNETIKGFKLAKFPEELPMRLIKMYSQPNDLILDPFAGMCTVGKVARQLGRNSVCVELNRIFEKGIHTYIGEYQQDMFQAAEIKYLYLGENDNVS